MLVARISKKEAAFSAGELVRTKKQQIITGGIIVLVLVLLYFGRGLLIAATVNGRPIARISLISELEKQGGNETLQSLITKELIKQEASKNKVTVSKDEINGEI